MLGTVRPMSTTSLTATASMASWAESPDHGPDAPLPRLAHAEVSFSYTGDLVAKSECNYSLSYARDGTGAATGFETITGQRDGEEGSFTLRHECRFHAEGVATDIAVVPGSGTGPFTDLDGSGHFDIGHAAESWEWTLTS